MLHERLTKVSPFMHPTSNSHIVKQVTCLFPVHGADHISFLNLHLVQKLQDIVLTGDDVIQKVQQSHLRYLRCDFHKVATAPYYVRRSARPFILSPRSFGLISSFFFSNHIQIPSFWLHSIVSPSSHRSHPWTVPR